MKEASAKAVIAELEEQIRILGGRAARYAGRLAEAEEQNSELKAEVQRLVKELNERPTW
jgi:chromosome segregation ATPase